MKTIFAPAAALAAFTSATSALADGSTPGHWEWQSRPTFGPNKSNLPSQVRVWTKASNSQMADCNCDMMKMRAADCMKAMHGKHSSSSKG